MNTARLRNLAHRARLTWKELDYVERRLFEMQTGIPVTGGPRRVVRDSAVRPYRRDY
jgi:hypothetical protein